MVEYFQAYTCQIDYLFLCILFSVFIGRYRDVPLGTPHSHPQELATLVGATPVSRQLSVFSPGPASVSKTILGTDDLLEGITELRKIAIL